MVSIAAAAGNSVMSVQTPDYSGIFGKVTRRRQIPFVVFALAFELRKGFLVVCTEGICQAVEKNTRNILRFSEVTLVTVRHESCLRKLEPIFYWT